MSNKKSKSNLNNNKQYDSFSLFDDDVKLTTNETSDHRQQIKDQQINTSTMYQNNHQKAIISMQRCVILILCSVLLYEYSRSLFLIFIIGLLVADEFQLTHTDSRSHDYSHSDQEVQTEDLVDDNIGYKYLDVNSEVTNNIKNAASSIEIHVPTRKMNLSNLTKSQDLTWLHASGNEEDQTNSSESDYDGSHELSSIDNNADTNNLLPPDEILRMHIKNKNLFDQTTSSFHQQAVIQTVSGSIEGDFQRSENNLWANEVFPAKESTDP
ncbi:unnamed protein product, partial [Rotaria sordida]